MNGENLSIFNQTTSSVDMEKKLGVISTEFNLLDGRIWIKVDDNGVNKEWDYRPSEELLCRRRG